MVLWFDSALSYFKISVDKNILFEDSQKVIFDYLLDNSATASIMLVDAFLYSS